MKRYIIGVTGASGSLLARRLLQFVSTLKVETHVVITDMGKRVFEYETGKSWHHFLAELNGSSIIEHDNKELFASIASGSFSTDGMIIVPCSMSTVGKIASGTGDNLLCRAADVCIKEKTRLVISPREAPLHSIHLRNLLTLSENGAVIIPPVPMFYANDDSYDGMINGIVGRILKSAGIENELYIKWGNRKDNNNE